MTNSARKRSNSEARRLAAVHSSRAAAQIRRTGNTFSRDEARRFSATSTVEVNWPLVAELFNRAAMVAQ